MKAILIIFSIIFSSVGENVKDLILEVPVFKVNFYLMGQKEVDEKITVEIGNNIEYLNQEFEGQVRFELNHLFMDPNHAYIPDLHQDHLTQDREKIDDLILPVEEGGAINIFLFDTYTKDMNRGAMMGFTPVLSAFYGGYQESTPRFDRLFISYPGLIDKSTIVHEMGHFLGLSHPWEMDDINLDLMGFNNPKAETNHMTYHPMVDNFTEEQLTRMRHHALTFRKYLLSHIELKIKSNDVAYNLPSPKNRLH